MLRLPPGTTPTVPIFPYSPPRRAGPLAGGASSTQRLGVSGWAVLGWWGQPGLLLVSPAQVVGHLERRVVRIVFGSRGGRFGARRLAMVEHDHAGIALTHLVGGRARQQFVMISEAGDHQCAGGQLPAQALVDQEGADGTVREPVLKLAGAGHLLVFDDLPRLEIG